MTTRFFHVYFVPKKKFSIRIFLRCVILFSSVCTFLRSDMYFVPKMKIAEFA